jgi:hypothetical protein
VHPVDDNLPKKWHFTIAAYRLWSSPHWSMGLSGVLMLPFRLLLPPILETPFSALQFPSTKLTVPLVILSFGAISGGSVFCFVMDPSWMQGRVGRGGKLIVFWLARRLDHQLGFETLLIGWVFALGGLSMIAAFWTLATGERPGLCHAYVYRFAFTFPVWVVLSLMAFKMKMMKIWGLNFMPHHNIDDD